MSNLTKPKGQITVERVANPNYQGQRNIVPTVNSASCSCGGDVFKSYRSYGDPDLRDIVWTCDSCHAELVWEK